ncbi:MAG TPA: DUF2779 domain-containing protein [Chitinophagales bacterium]|nr:DUF2779 domain-containing protein [Chitinophagales bacterium]
MEKHLLSKSTFLRGLQCLKSLYLYKNFIQLRAHPSTEQKAIFNRGNSVGMLARQFFPGGTDATPTKRSDSIAAVTKTKMLLEQGVEIIYEAAFQFNGVLAILDILVKSDGVWRAYEVKSSTKISQVYLLDASLQYWVITNSGLPLFDFSVMIINNQYVRRGEVDIQQLFTIKSVKESVLKQQKFIEENIDACKQVIQSNQMPEIGIGEHCFIPYACDFMSTCWKHVPADSVFDIIGVPKSEQFDLYKKGYTTIKEIPSENGLDKNANIHIQAVKTQQAVINKSGILSFLSSVQYPVFFMDFESFMPAIPIYDGTKPYQHIPFQYSIHFKEKKEGFLQHVEFLADQGMDPRKSFLENLLKHTETQGTILVYDILMERNILKGLQKDFPEYSSEIDNRLERMVDLVQPFLERHYYHPAMKNSVSIKNVLPALVPELNYSDLIISSGSIAMTAFEQLQTESDLFKIIEMREHLLAYCKMDTLAMVKIFEILENAVLL